MFVLFFYECHHLTSWDLYYPTKKWIVQFYGVHPIWQFAGLPKCVCSGWNQLNQCLISLFALFRPTVQRKSSGACSDISSKFHRSVGAREQFRSLSVVCEGFPSDSIVNDSEWKEIRACLAKVNSVNDYRFLNITMPIRQLAVFSQMHGNSRCHAWFLMRSTIFLALCPMTSCPECHEWQRTND
jgi:hypothetical protein